MVCCLEFSFHMKCSILPFSYSEKHLAGNRRLSLICCVHFRRLHFLVALFVSSYISTRVSPSFSFSFSSCFFIFLLLLLLLLPLLFLFLFLFLSLSLSLSLCLSVSESRKLASSRLFPFRWLDLSICYVSVSYTENQIMLHLASLIYRVCWGTCLQL